MATYSPPSPPARYAPPPQYVTPKDPRQSRYMPPPQNSTSYGQGTSGSTYDQAKEAWDRYLANAAENRAKAEAAARQQRYLSENPEARYPHAPAPTQDAPGGRRFDQGQYGGVYNPPPPPERRFQQGQYGSVYNPPGRRFQQGQYGAQYDRPSQVDPYTGYHAMGVSNPMSLPGAPQVSYPYTMEAAEQVRNYLRNWLGTWPRSAHLTQGLPPQQTIGGYANYNPSAVSQWVLETLQGMRNDPGGVTQPPIENPGYGGGGYGYGYGYPSPSYPRYGGGRGGGGSYKMPKNYWYQDALTWNI